MRAFEVGVDRKIGRAHDRRDMRQHLVLRAAAVGVAHRPGGAGARRRQCLEAQRGEIFGAADIPRIGNDEASAFVQAAEFTAFIGDGGHDVGSGLKVGELIRKSGAGRCVPR
jgi:hypothetical protein